ncbi:hypothetical protein MVES1_002670 [Malassezia vespertilionis]|uniref:Peptidase M20 dimerisation domain-containing protein n=1 Tax=Malassezia vespertilionis TaxID=2020962 RepID=A0A2N1JAB0_9BASI|nr:uncharacterized protein MVES1_002670 [Malassezia vespertilionis]PKI83477.1 hypothetical protein MVES_002521 [Malassezia vespertilionis]WFD07307.1 hypothetical protein MVES1_002670 [Malassezia vespertilionis]
MAGGESIRSGPVGTLDVATDRFVETDTPLEQKANQHTRALQTVSFNDASVLSVAIDQRRGILFCGSQCGTIFVWDMSTQQQLAQLMGHTRSVLALEIAPGRDWLFSASSDSTVRQWDLATYEPLSLIYPASDNSGDIFSMAWCSQQDTLFFGCQDTSIQWISITPTFLDDAPRQGLPESRPHKFFDSMSRAMGSSQNTLPLAVRTAEQLIRRTAVQIIAKAGEAPKSRTPSKMVVLAVSKSHVLPSAHFGYVYSMIFVPTRGEVPLLASGSGDETVRLWAIVDGNPVLQRTLEVAEPTGDTILTMCAWETTLLAGKQGGLIDVWDMDSYTQIRALRGHTDDVLCLQLSDLGGELTFFSGSADGHVCRWNKYFQCDARWIAHADIVQSCALYFGRKGAKSQYSWLTTDPMLVTGSSDASVRLWPLLSSPLPGVSPVPPPAHPPCSSLLHRLSEFVGYKSVSHGPTLLVDAENSEDARQAAHFLKNTLMQLGASEVQLIPCRTGANPMVLGTFKANSVRGAKRRCLFYGHYDCMPASEDWESNPWELHGRNGYLYARGVSDNKGPVLAVAYAASDLLHAHQLDVDVVMLVEGEQETGSKGFHACLQANRALLGHIDVILVCNSYWLGEQRPCITVGLRGVIQAMVRITALRSDIHSGVDGGAVQEPMMDMVKLLATLTDANGHVALRGFYDHVSPVDEQEHAYYSKLAHEVQKQPERLIARWCKPSFTVHQVTNSGPSHATVIPSSVEASLSIRIVPNQDLHAVERILEEGIRQNYVAMQSTNQLDVRIFHRADWWLGSLELAYTHALVAAVEAEWHEPPVMIREGGSIPGIAILEKELGAQAVHLPMGQASDHAHLPNERIRLINLEKGQAVVRRFFQFLGDMD